MPDANSTLVRPSMLEGFARSSALCDRFATPPLRACCNASRPELTYRVKESCRRPVRRVTPDLGAKRISRSQGRVNWATALGPAGRIATRPQ